METKMSGVKQNPEKARFEKWLADSGYPADELAGNLEVDDAGHYVDRDYLLMFDAWMGHATAVPQSAVQSSSHATSVAVFEGWEDYGDRQRPLITVTGNLCAGDVLYVRQSSPEVQPVTKSGKPHRDRYRTAIAHFGGKWPENSGEATYFKGAVIRRDEFEERAAIAKWEAA